MSLTGRNQFEHTNYLSEQLRDSHEHVCELKEEIINLREVIDLSMPILDNLLYWDTCPDEYKEKIEKIQQMYNPQTEGEI